MSFDGQPEARAREASSANLASSLLAWVTRLSDRQLATLLGAVLFVVGGWPLLNLRLAPYQDLPDHLATACVLLNPERYPEYVSNGWFKANSLLVSLIYLLSKGVGVLGAGKVLPFAVVGATAFSLPHFVLSFTDRKRLLVATLIMAPMVHNWWTLIGMLNFVLGFALALVLLGMLARQEKQATRGRGLAIAVTAGLLWFTHAIVFLLVGLLVLIETLVSPGGRDGKLRAARTLLAPLVPVGLLAGITILRHAGTAHAPEFGYVDAVRTQPLYQAFYDLWAHWFLGLSFHSAAGIVNALALVFFAARAGRARVPFFSVWALAVLSAIYFFFPLRMPGFGYVCERVLPFMWVWALVRVPDRLPPWLARALVASSVAWSIGLGLSMFKCENELDEFISAAPEIPAGAQLVTLNFQSSITSTNMWSLVHASGMYTVLRGAHPQDVWADSASMPFRHARKPLMVEDPVRIREFLGVAGSPEHYCAQLEVNGFIDVDCTAQWRSAWAEFWAALEARYDFIILWGAPDQVRSTLPPELVTRMVNGHLELLTRPGVLTAGQTAP